MESVTDLFYLTLLVSPILALIAAAIVYWRFRAAPVANRRRSAVLFVLGIVLLGGMAGWVGIVVGIAVFCIPGAGAQCGFGGIFFTGPLAFSIAVAIYLWAWARRGRST